MTDKLNMTIHRLPGFDADEHLIWRYFDQEDEIEEGKAITSEEIVAALVVNSKYEHLLKECITDLEETWTDAGGDNWAWIVGQVINKMTAFLNEESNG